MVARVQPEVASSYSSANLTRGRDAAGELCQVRQLSSSWVGPPSNSDPLTDRGWVTCVCVCFSLASLIEIAGKVREKKGNGYSVDYGPGLRLLGERERGSQTPRSPNWETHTHILCGPRYGTHPHGSQKQETQKNCRKMIFREMKFTGHSGAPEPEELNFNRTSQLCWFDKTQWGANSQRL